MGIIPTCTRPTTIHNGRDLFFCLEFNVLDARSLPAFCRSRWAGGEGEGSIARETFVNSLAKFTLLDTVKEMRPKSIDCVRALVDIALEDGNYLSESWGSVLRYISQLARLQASVLLFVFFLVCSIVSTQS